MATKKRQQTKQNRQYIIGVDLGGTNIVVGAMSADGKQHLAMRSIPTSTEAGAEGVADRIVGLIEGIRLGLLALNSTSRVAGVVFWSFVLWLVNALSFYVGFAAFGIEVGFIGALLLQGLVSFGVSVPSTPGYIGPFEAAIVAALALYGVGESRAFSFAIAYHVTTFVPITLLGLWSVARTPIRLGDLRRQPAPAEADRPL